ncbi:hypothetical protein [Aeromicrobium sp. A1-2]|uniref:hypothetical protein n=1 Tax=Aeromicrobium sp. A1-2 TaxID=2107713 RepID=UPI0013C2DF51|nr:hypothetical protein [Aeromicrobium sp. A1-2]
MFGSSSYDPELRRRRLIVAAATAVVLLAAAITYVLLTRNQAAAPPPADPTTATAPQMPVGPPAEPDDGTLPKLPSVADPVEFADLVAHAIFDWDTNALAPRAAYVERIATIADPTGEETPGLISDVDAYLPPETTWIDLREYETRQWIGVESVEVPAKWATALEQGSATLAPGTTAYTITAVRHRDGIWDDKPVSSRHDVTFTVFIICAPTYDACRLLRLSLLDEPLE